MRLARFALSLLLVLILPACTAPSGTTGDVRDWEDPKLTLSTRRRHVRWTVLEGVDVVRHSARQGNVHAMLMLGDYLAAGSNTPSPPGYQVPVNQRQESLRWFRLAAGRGSIYGMVRVADVIARGFAVASPVPTMVNGVVGRTQAQLLVDELEAEGWLQRAARSGNSVALRSYGELLTRNRLFSVFQGLPGSPEARSVRTCRAVDSFRQAARLGDKEARWLLRYELDQHPQLAQAGDRELTTDGSAGKSSTGR